MLTTTTPRQRPVLAVLTALLTCALLGAQTPSLVHDVNPGPAGSDPCPLGSVGGRVFFQADDGVHGREPWLVTGAGVRLYRDMNPGPADAFRSIGWHWYTAPDAHLFAGYVDDGVHGPEMWALPRSTGCGNQIVDVNPGTGGGYPSALVRTTGTVVKYYFTAVAPNGRRELFHLTYGGAQAPCPDLDAGQLTNGVTVNSESLVTVGTSVYCLAGDRSGAWRTGGLWRSDGTLAGTRMVKDFSTWFILDGSMVKFAEALWFFARHPTAGPSLCAYDLTNNATNNVRVVAPLAGATSNLHVVGLRLVFSHAGGGGNSDEELWAGTGAGIHLVKDIQPGPGSSSPNHVTPFGNGFLFPADDGTHGRELWFSDGTSAGTVLVKDIQPGPGGGLYGSGAGGRGRFFVTGRGSRRTAWFAADDGQHGMELWRTDGTAVGTRMVMDINPGVASSTPESNHLWEAGGRVYFSADDGTHGRELWAFLPGAAAVSVGASCSDGTRVPTLDLDGDPVLGTRVTFQGEGAQDGVLGVFLLSVGDASAYGLGHSCFLYPDPSQLLASVAFPRPGNGVWNLPVDVPPQRSLVGVQLTGQTGFLGTNSPVGLDLTNALTLTLGF